MLEPILTDFKGLEEDCKELVLSAYLNHRSELITLQQLPYGAIVIGDNWSYSARTSLGKNDLSPTNPITKELRKKKIDSIQYTKHFQDDEGNWPYFYTIVLAHLQIPPKMDPEYLHDYLFELRKFLALFLIGESRIKEAEVYKSEWNLKRQRMSARDLPQRILFLYDSQLNDRGVINLSQ